MTASETNTSNINKLSQYNSIITSIGHMDDITSIDERTLFITAHVNNKHQLAKTREDIYWELNKYMSGSALTISPTRSPSLYISDDVEGSRRNNPDTNSAMYPHLHGILVLPKETFQAIPNMDAYIAKLEACVRQVDGVCRETLTWKARLVLDTGLVNNEHALDAFLKTLKSRFPVITGVRRNTPNVGEITLLIVRDQMATSVDQDNFLMRMKNSIPEIMVLDKLFSWKSVDIKPYDYNKSLFTIAGYASKLLDQTDTHSGFHYDTTVCPFEINKKFIKKPHQKAALRIRADELSDSVLCDPSLAFSERYLARFGDEFAGIIDANERNRRLSSANYNGLVQDGKRHG